MKTPADAVQAKPRGRPKRYDPAQALQSAMAAFWLKGYAGTSVDDLCQATGLNKPSLYAGLGDKREVYCAALQAYVQQVGGVLRALLSDPKLTARQALAALIQQAVALYCPNPDGPGRGCFLVVTAPAAAWDIAEVRDWVRQALAEQDAAFSARVRLAQAQGELSADLDADAVGKLLSAALHTLALRARTGERRQALEALGCALVDAALGVSSPR